MAILFGATMPDVKNGPPTKLENLSFITKENTFERFIELEILRYVYIYQQKSYLEREKDPFRSAVLEWERNPKEYIKDSMYGYLYYFIGKIWCETSKAKWEPNSISELNSRDLLEDCKKFFREGGTMETNGVSLEQAWFLETVRFKTPFLSVINKNMPLEENRRIAYKAVVDTGGMLGFFDYLCSEENTNIRYYSSMDYRLFTTPAYIYDGENGHHIELFGFNLFTNNIIYFDPFPYKSLLCFENNKAGVNAQRYQVPIPLSEYSSTPLWQVTKEELEKVIYAIFIPLHIYREIPYVASLSLEEALEKIHKI